MQNPLTKTILNHNPSLRDQWNALKITVEQQRDFYETRKPGLSELEQKQEELKLERMEKLLDDLKIECYKDKMSQLINDPSIAEKTREKDAVDDFLDWDKKNAVEALNFLLQEFFTHSFPKTNWNAEFISELVFKHTRVINLIVGLKRINNKDLQD